MIGVSPIGSVPLGSAANDAVELTPELYFAAPGPLGAPALLAALIDPDIRISVPTMLGGAVALLYEDFSAFVADGPMRFVMDMVTPTGVLRVPISSWQATLRTGASNYLQCVVPACAAWAGQIDAATEFAIYRLAVLPDGAVFVYEMARAPASQKAFDQGPARYTCTLRGYSSGFATYADPPATYDRDLTGIRSIHTGTGGMRVRCAVDWMLRPGHRAFADGQALVVSYINYYAPSGFDSYMDVGGT